MYEVMWEDADGTFTIGPSKLIPLAKEVGRLVGGETDEGEPLENWVVKVGKMLKKGEVKGEFSDGTLTLLKR